MTSFMQFGRKIFFPRKADVNLVLTCCMVQILRFVCVIVYDGIKNATRSVLSTPLQLLLTLLCQSGGGCSQKKVKFSSTILSINNGCCCFEAECRPSLLPSIASPEQTKGVLNNVKAL